MKNLCKYDWMKGYFTDHSHPLKGFLSLLLITTAFTSCTNESENITSKEKQLQLNVAISRPESRAVVTGNNLIDGSSIGVTVVDATGTAYQSQDYNNVCYTGNTVDGTQKWTPDRTVTLSGEPATLYAYYPWTEGVDVEAVPVDMTTADQNDWMYATPVTGLSDANAGATVSLHHALANIRLTLYKENYSGAGVVSSYSFQSDAFATGGTLNAKTGTFDALTGEGAALTRTVDYTLTDKASATAFDCMVVPTGASDDIDVSVTVDGHTYTSTVAAISLTREVAYNLTLKLSSTGLSVTSVSLVDWNEADLGEENFTPVVDADTRGSSVTLVYNITESDDEVNTGSTGYGARLLDYDADVSLIESMKIDGVELTPTDTYIFDETGEYTIEITFKDKTTIPENTFYGIKTITSVELGKDIRTIGDEAFIYCQISRLSVEEGNTTFDSRNDCNAIMETATNTLVLGCENTTIPEDCEIIGTRAFGFMSAMTELIVPNSVRVIGARAFNKNKSLTRIVLGENVETIGDNAFFWCFSLQEITWNEKLKTIGKMAFADNEWISGTLTLPNSVTTIGMGAFAQCYELTGLELGTEIKEIGDEAFSECTSLKSIKCQAMTAPTIEAATFYNVAENGTLTVQAGAAGYDAWMGEDEYYLGYSNWTMQQAAD